MVTKQRRRTSDWLARHALAYARRGNPHPLIARLLFLLQRGGEPLRRDETLFIIEALEATAGKELNADLRQLEKELIALRVEGLMIEEGLLQKQAIGIVQDERKRSVRHIKRAIAARTPVRKKRRRRDGSANAK